MENEGEAETDDAIAPAPLPTPLPPPENDREMKRVNSIWARLFFKPVMSSSLAFSKRLRNYAGGKDTKEKTRTNEK